MKTCYCCGETKESSFFGKNKRNKDNLASECRSCKSNQDKAYRLNNSESILRQKREAYHNARGQHKRLTWAEWSKQRKDNAVGDQILKNIHNTKRRQQMRNQEMSELDELVMTEAYKLAETRTKLTGFKWHVDHIVPLFHKQCCGLNNAHNLQVVPAAWNIQKSNRNMAVYWPIKT